MLQSELFYQIQYLIHKYFYLITFIQILLLLLPFFLIRVQNFLTKSIPYFIIYIFTGIYFLKVFPLVFFAEGWDRQSICGWIDLSNNYENFNIYTIQLPSSSRYLNSEIPNFSLYYHPVLLNKFELFCSITSTTFNFLILNLYVLTVLVLTKNLNNVKKSSIIILVFYAFNNLLWSLLTGQFLFLELTSLLIALICLKKQKYKIAILFTFIFGIQKIYFFIFSIYLAFKYFKWRGLFGLLILFISINLISLNLIPDFLNFWFSDEGYLFGNRESRHSFILESFGPNNQSLFFLLKDSFSAFNISINIFALLIILMLASFGFILYFYNKFRDATTSYSLDLIVLISFILLYPLLKPYAFIYVSVIILFLLDEINKLEIEDFTVALATLPGVTYMLISDFLYVNIADEVSFLVELQYKFLMLYNFFSSWLFFIYLYIVFTKKIYVKNQKSKI